MPQTSQAEVDCACEDNPTLDVLAIVNGTKIRKDDLSPDTRSKIRLLQDTVVEARNRELDKVIAARLLDAAAKSRGLTRRKLLQIEVTGKVVPPTEAEAEVFYNHNRQLMQKSFKESKDTIIAAMRTEREVQEAQKFANALRVAASVKVLVDRVGPPANADERSRILAIVNGSPITAGEVEDSLAPFVFQVKQQTYSYRKSELDLKINDMLLEQEAKKQGITALALVAREVSRRVAPITEQQVVAYYDQNRARFGKDLPMVRLQITQYLLASEEQRLAHAYAEQLRSRASVQVFLRPPGEPAYKISTADQPSRGNENAAVTVVEFTDYANPECAAQFPVLEQLIAAFGGRVRLVVRDFPDPNNKNSLKAAEAAEAAYQQGKYWEFVKRLFENPAELQTDRLKKYAAEVGLDRERFADALENGMLADQVQLDIVDGNKIGVVSTPTFFVNGRRTSKAELQSAIQTELNKN